MAKALSIDLRKRAVEAIVADMSPCQATLPNNTGLASSLIKRRHS